MKFIDFSDYLMKIERISSRLEMTYLLADIFKKIDLEEVDKAIYLLQGKLLPEYYGVEIGIGERFVVEAISISSGYQKEVVDNYYKKTGDLGIVAEQLISKRRQSSLSFKELSIKDVYTTLLKIAKTTGSGSQTLKIRYLVELYNNASPIEARYITRIVLGKLRLGIGDATMLDALSYVIVEGKELREEIERAYTLCSDLGFVAKRFIEDPDSIKKFKISIGKPIRPALAERISSPEEVYKRLGRCALEYKYDGFRMQVHKKGEEVLIFSRKLERMENMFPDLVNSIKKLPVNEVIFEGEALAFNEEKNRFFSFQETMHRRRKYGIEEASKAYPLYLFAFDIMFVEGKDYTLNPFIERRKELEKLFPYGKIKLSNLVFAERISEIRQFFSEALKKGLEGIMAKDINATYKAGKRGFAWIKLKKGYESEVDTVDALVVGYYLGRGSRAKFGFGGVLVAVYNETRDRFETIAKVGSGFTEEEMVRIRSKLEKIKISSPFRALHYNEKPDFWVEPRYVVEIAFDEITLSPFHTCYEEENGGKGFALRFPRFVRVREDKDIYDVTTSKEIYDIYSFMKE